jgi:hypothetical protein
LLSPFSYNDKMILDASLKTPSARTGPWKKLKSS